MITWTGRGKQDELRWKWIDKFDLVIDYLFDQKNLKNRM